MFRKLMSAMVATAAALFAGGAARAQAEPDPAAAPPADQGSAQDLAKQLANPVASLISIPFQEIMDFGIGPDNDGFKSTLNVQPVVPVSLSPEWNLIVRTIVPMIYQDDVTAPGVDESGLGDTLQSLFFSPAKPSANGILSFRLCGAADRHIRLRVGVPALLDGRQRSWRVRPGNFPMFMDGMLWLIEP